MRVLRHLPSLTALSIALASFTVLAQPPVPQHPLDGLTSSEYWAVHDILHKSGHMTPDTGVSTLLLHAPLKSMSIPPKTEPVPQGRQKIRAVQISEMVAY